MMSNHTPGPWRVDENYVVSELGADSGDGLRACDVHSWTIAEIPDCSAAVDEIGLVELGQGVKEANARLIASAPDLLELAAMVEEEYREGGDWQSVANEARRLLEKVRGGA